MLRVWGLNETGDICEAGQPPIASILLVAAGRGVFGEVLRVSGIGAALSSRLHHFGLPIIVLGFETGQGRQESPSHDS